MPLVLVFFSSKRFGICKRPIWGVNNKGWEIRVRVRVLGVWSWYCYGNLTLGTLGKTTTGERLGIEQFARGFGYWRRRWTTIPDEVDHCRLVPDCCIFLAVRVFCHDSRERGKKNEHFWASCIRDHQVYGLCFVLFFFLLFVTGLILTFFFPLLSSWWFFIFLKFTFR